MNRRPVSRRRTKPDHEAEALPCAGGCGCDVIDVAGVGFWRVVVTPPGGTPSESQVFCLPCIATLALCGLRLTPPSVHDAPTRARQLVTNLRKEWKL